MSWTETPKRLFERTSGRTTRPVEGRSSPGAQGPCSSAEAFGRVRTASLCVASGKGGTGKSVVSASLAALFGLRGRTLVVDADLGVGNAHILQDLSPPRTLVDVVEGRATVAEVCVACSERVDLVPSGAGVPRMAELSTYELHLIANGLAEIEERYGYLVLDSAAGVSTQTLVLAQACDRTLVVTTPDLTAMTDAYAFLKLLVDGCPGARPLLLVNRASDAEEAARVEDRIGRVCERFLGTRPLYVGWLPEDPAVRRCVNRRGPVVLLEPAAPVSSALRRTAVGVLGELASQHAQGFGRRLLRRRLAFSPSAAQNATEASRSRPPWSPS